MTTTVLKPEGETQVLSDIPKIALTTVASDSNLWNNEICGPILGEIDAQGLDFVTFTDTTYSIEDSRVVQEYVKIVLNPSTNDQINRMGTSLKVIYTL